MSIITGNYTYHHVNVYHIIQLTIYFCEPWESANKSQALDGSENIKPPCTRSVNQTYIANHPVLELSKTAC